MLPYCNFNAIFTFNFILNFTNTFTFSCTFTITFFNTSPLHSPFAFHLLPLTFYIIPFNFYVLPFELFTCLPAVLLFFYVIFFHQTKFDFHCFTFEFSFFFNYTISFSHLFFWLLLEIFSLFFEKIFLFNYFHLNFWVKKSFFFHFFFGMRVMWEREGSGEGRGGVRLFSFIFRKNVLLLYFFTSPLFFCPTFIILRQLF